MDINFHTGLTIQQVCLLASVSPSIGLFTDKILKIICHSALFCAQQYVCYYILELNEWQLCLMLPIQSPPPTTHNQNKPALPQTSQQEPHVAPSIPFTNNPWSQDSCVASNLSAGIEEIAPSIIFPAKISVHASTLGVSFFLWPVHHAISCLCF